MKLQKLYIWDKRKNAPKERWGAIVGRVAFLMAKKSSNRADVIPSARVYTDPAACVAQWHSTQKVFVVPQNRYDDEPEFTERLMIKGSRRPRSHSDRYPFGGGEVVELVSHDRVCLHDASLVFTTKSSLTKYLLEKAREDVSRELDRSKRIQKDIRSLRDRVRKLEQA